MTGTRKPNQRSSIFEGADGYWHGYVTVGHKPDGRLDRRHLQATTEAGVTTPLTIHYLGLPQYPELLKTGEVVRIIECAPKSKTKTWEVLPAGGAAQA